MTSKREVDYRVLADFRYQVRRYLNFSEQAARAAGIEPHQHLALLAIKGLPKRTKPTVGVLAERLQIQHHSAVELSDRLEARGLIRRVRSRADRREVHLRLTGKAERLVRDLSMPHRAELHAVGLKLLHALQAALAQPRNESNHRSPAAASKKELRRQKKVAGDR